MALMAAHGELTPMPDFAIFADTQAEAKSTYRFLDTLEKLLPFPIHRVTRGSLTKSITTIRERKDKNGFWVHSGLPTYNINPDGSFGHVPRSCTVSFKIEVIDKNIRRLACIKRGQKTIGVVQWIGISLDEAHRMKPSRHPWSQHIWPLVDAGIRRSDCLEWIKKHGYPEPPRSACVYCPYHSDAEWRRLKTQEPEEFAEAVRVDKEHREAKAHTGMRGVPYLHASRKPLDEVDFSNAEDNGQLNLLFGNECSGMCGV
jgi:hypothetical protein